MKFLLSASSELKRTHRREEELARKSGKEERALIKKLCKTVISLLRLRTPERRRVVISADLLFLEEKK